MRVLIIKMSSLGDVVHTLPAITDACNNIPGIRFDWVVEEAFAEIPAWHPGVDKVIPIAWRRWRKSLLSLNTWREIRKFLSNLRAEKYDLVLDAQGLIKSSLIAWLGHGPRIGLDADSAREGFAARFYHDKVHVPKGQHAIYRLRQLFAASLDYSLPDTNIDYGLVNGPTAHSPANKPYLLFLHGTTWETKLWPEAYWCELGNTANIHGFEILLPWGNDSEHARAQRIADKIPGARVLPKLHLAELKSLLENAHAVIGVDTGLSHIAAASGTRTIGIYGATDPGLTGILGKNVIILNSNRSCAPCVSPQCRFDYEHHDPRPPCYQSIAPNAVMSLILK